MTTSEIINPNFEEKTTNALKADRTVHRVTFNPNKASPGETLFIQVPKLNDEVVLVPGSLALIFDLTLSGHANNFLVNNVSRALVNRLTVKFAGEILQDTDGYDLFKLYEDLFLTEKERANRLSEGIQSEDLAKIRCNAGDKKTTGVAKEIKLNGIYGNKYRIPIDHEILNHGVFFPRALSDELVFELRLAPASNVVKGSDASKLAYELTNIQLEYEVIHSKQLADEAESNYKNGKRLMYEHITHHKTISFAKGTDSIINESINVPRRSMKGLLLLFYEGYTGGARDSEKTYNPDITEVKVVVNGIPNKIYSQGMKTRDFWEEIFRRFGKENSSLDATDFYAGDRFALFVDLRSMKENNLHGSGLRLVNTKEGVQLSIKRNTSGSGNAKCYIFILSDAQINIVNKELESVTY